MTGLEPLRLHLTDEALPLWHAVQVETGDPGAALPYWAFAWGGGLALAHDLVKHPESVAGRRYEVRTTTELEDLALREGRVYRLAESPLPAADRSLRH